MRIVLFLIIGLCGLSLRSQADASMIVIEKKPGEIDVAATEPHPPTEAPVILVAPEPKSVSIQESLAAKEDPFVAGTDLDKPDDDPNEADEDGEEGSDEDSEDETEDEE